MKLALTSYDAKTGEMYESFNPVYGFSHQTDWVVLLFIGWDDNDLMPDPANDEWVGEGTSENTAPNFVVGR